MLDLQGLQPIASRLLCGLWGYPEGIPRCAKVFRLNILLCFASGMAVNIVYLISSII
jgi:hypothetical protein